MYTCRVSWYASNFRVAGAAASVAVLLLESLDMPSPSYVWWSCRYLETHAELVPGTSRRVRLLLRFIHL